MVYDKVGYGKLLDKNIIKYKLIKYCFEILYKIKKDDGVDFLKVD